MAAPLGRTVDPGELHEPNNLICLCDVVYAQPMLTHEILNLSDGRNFLSRCIFLHRSEKGPHGVDQVVKALI